MRNKHIKMFNEQMENTIHPYEIKSVDYMINRFNETFVGFEDLSEEVILAKIKEYVIWIDIVANTHSREVNDKVDFVKDTVHLGFDDMGSTRKEILVRKLTSFKCIVTNLSNRMKKNKLYCF